MRLALVTELLDWVRPFFTTFGYAIVSVGMLLESAAFTGLLVPGDLIVALGGVYAAQGDLSLVAVIACATVFGVLGESVGYLLGLRYGDGLIRRVPLLRRFQGKIDEAERSIEEHAGRTIVAGRFVTGAAGLIPFVAGASRVRPRTFYAFTIPTMLVWSTALSLVGFFVGNHVGTIDRVLSSAGWVGLAIVATVVGVWLWRHRDRA